MDPPNPLDTIKDGYVKVTVGGKTKIGKVTFDDGVYVDLEFSDGQEESFSKNQTKPVSEGEWLFGPGLG